MPLKVASKGDSGRANEPSSIVLENISWERLERLMEDLDGRYLRLTYDSGRLAMMAPIGLQHGKIKSLLHDFVRIISLELDIPIASLGSMTWKRKRLLKAIEGDECYYVQSEPQMRGKFEIDEQKAPSPDLAIEVEVSHYPI